MIKAILTDIEGTTTSLSFVKDTLFPYARERIGEFVRGHGTEAPVRKCLEEARRIAGDALTDDQLIQRLIRWIDEDRKITPLKELQGMIWDLGYKKGDFQGHVYDDAVRNLRKWKSQGIRLYIFSSGSIAAQRLLFGHTPYGDLQPLFDGYFDTASGPKKEPESYRKIAAAIGVETQEMLFLSDVRDELDAARMAGMRTVLVDREGTADAGPATRAWDFDAISVE